MEVTKHKFISTPIGVHERERRGLSVPDMKQMLYGQRMARSHSLFKRDLRGHFGCVNAIEFSTDGQLIASGGDDRRLLLWDIGRTIFDDKAPHVIDTLHISNINTCCFDADNRKVSTGGNDGQVIVHDINVRQSTSVYGLSDAVYCLSPDPINATILAAASDDGKAQILDFRMSIDTPPFVLADLSTAMHSIMYNPAEPRLLATANSKHGIGLWDIRMPLKCINYKSNVQNCMSVRFNSRGDRLLALRRRSSPVLYEVGKMHPVFEFDYKTYYNACTLKSCSFAGLQDEYVMSGSDDFCIYLWKIPTHISDNYIQSEPHMILKGHRSIVNQVRYCPYNQVIISSGVEKLVKIWSPYYIPGCTGRLIHSRRYGDDDEVERDAYTHEEYIHMVLQAGSFLSHDYSNGSTDEEPCMIAFFDSLIQREIEQSTEGDKNDDDDSSDDSSNFGQDDDWGGGSKKVSSSVPSPPVEREDSRSTSNAIVSSTMEDSSRTLFVDLDSSSDSEGEVDVILSAMYSRFMSARERAVSSGFRPSGKKISSVIAKGKLKDITLNRNMSYTKRQRKRTDLRRNGDQFLSENAANRSILADVLDNFVDSLVARESSSSLVLSDTNDDHPSINNLRESSNTPVEIIHQTITLDADGSSPTTSRHFPHLSVTAEDSPSLPAVPVTLESGLYFMPELQAFAPETYNVVTSVTESASHSLSDGVNTARAVERGPSTSLHSDDRASRSGSSAEIVHNGSNNHYVMQTAESSLPTSSSSTSLTSSSSVTTCRTLTRRQNDHCVEETHNPITRPSSKCNSLFSTASQICSNHQMESAPSASLILTSVDSECSTTDLDDHHSTEIASQKLKTVQFKKIKLKGKQFRVHGSGSRSRSSSDDEM